MQRKIMPGENWMYYKIYAGPKFIDELLCNEIYQLKKKLTQEGLIDTYFFVRYTDEYGYHLRLRFYLIKKENIHHVLSILNEYLKKYFEGNIIWKISLDSYNREFERYGENIIEEIESIFQFSSEVILEDMKINELNQGISERWVRAIYFADKFLSEFGLDNTRKLKIYEMFYNSYSNEFAANKVVNSILKDSYRTKSKSIETIIFNNTNSYIPDFNPIRNTIRNILNEYNANSSMSIEYLLMSLLHMHFNRVFITKQRANEFVIFYFMKGFYKSRIARNNHI